MQNKLVDLHNHLFEQLERLNDDELDEKKLDMEIKRSDAMSKISNQIISNYKVQLDSAKFLVDNGYYEKGQDIKKLMIGTESNDKKSTV